MTLKSLQSKLKLFSVLSLLALYGAGLFVLGRLTSLPNLLKVQHPKTSQIEKPVETSLPYTDSQAGSVISSYVKLCSNTVFAYELSYPKDWFTTYGTEDQKCSFFAPYSFVVPQDTTNFQVPVRIEVVQSPDWAETTKFYSNPNELQNVLSSENIEIGGKNVQKVKATSTGTNMQGRGLLKISYLVFHDKNPLVITYHQLDASEDIGKFEEELAEMVGTLRYF